MTVARWMARCAKVALLSVLLLSPARARAWSDPGHEAICQIALLELTPATRRKVNKILSPDSQQFKPFARACAWADDQKGVAGSLQHARRDEHFVNVKRSCAAITSENCGATPSCLFTAIHADAAALTNTTGADQLTALKFLGHWIGDLHQPLHVSYADDRGGNDIPVSQAAGCQQLHALWDYCIPETLRARMGASRRPTDLGTKLHAEITDAERTQWRRGSLVEWAQESYAIARKADTRYCLMQGDRCCYDVHACQNAAGNDRQRQTSRLTHLPHSYDEDEVGTVKLQFKKAGVRLAALLEKLLH